MMFDLDKETERVSGLMEELHEQFVEMGQIKTDFDSEQFTTGKDGDFIASQFHFLMRQYRFAVQESRRMLLEYERNERELGLLCSEEKWRESDIDYKTSSPSTKSRLRAIEFIDLQKIEVENRQRELEIDVSGKLRVIAHFEKLREALIEKNGGSPPTNEQFQLEQPEYYTWFLNKKMMQQIQSRRFGLSEGLLDSIMMAQRTPVLPGSKMQISQIIMDDGSLDLSQHLHHAILDCDRQGEIEAKSGPETKKLETLK